MITVEEAQREILSSIAPIGPERVDILSSLNRVLAEDIIAERNIPPRDNSAMDGYAIFSEDTANASRDNPISLEIVDNIPAGSVPRHRLNRGQAARIMTGAPIPDGANAVVRIEDTALKGNRVHVYVRVEENLDIRRAAEDVRSGEKVISAGTVVGPAEIGMLAALGRSFISVYQRPLVAVLSTGNELVDIDQIPTAGKITDSNSYALAAQIQACGALPVVIGIAKDSKDDLNEKFRIAGRCDIILSSGGVSVGDYDLVKNIMQEIGNTMKFWQVAMRPGRPLAFGNIGGKPVLGLPGNPVSSMVSFEQFVRPALLKMMGREQLYRKRISAVINESIAKKPGLRYFIRVRLMEKDGLLTALSTGSQGSGILKSMVMADGLVELPEDVVQINKGDIVSVQVLR